ncbi:unnamed protein product [Allacma fusca]|uniref:Protein kinase domain-containing protein n=1 Tax=Allacma fusca TaxID=39272 RepID=A0A8J2K2Z2_9HEXA|nr:unnamed protein product [Allacma fusca]
MKNSLWNFLHSPGIITFGFYLISVHLFVLIRGSSSHPIISYCSSSEDSLSILKDCKFTIISNSTFEFGKIDENVVEVSLRSRQQFVFLKCEAPYPIRWLAPKPLGSVRYISTDETNRADVEPLKETNLTLYTQAVLVKIPIAQEFQGQYNISIIRSDRRAVQMAMVDDNCAECICKASSHCENFPCDSENVCGGIPKEYYDPNIGLNGCNTTTLAECLKKKRLTFTRIRYQTKDYDPRIGLKVLETPDSNFKYEFNIPWDLQGEKGTFVLKPLPGKIFLKLKVFSSGYESLTDQFEEIQESEITPRQRFVTKFSQGYLECSGSYVGQFLSKIDYFFTGLDNRKYLMSDPFPQERIIKMLTKLEQPVRVVTTDQIIPEINANATTPSGVNEPDELLPKTNSSDGTLPGISTIKSTKQLQPKINFTDSTRPGVDVNDATELVYEYVKIGGAVAGVIIILILILIIYVATRRRVVIVLNLSPEEVKEFLVGTEHHNTSQNESTPVESRPFNPEYKICNQDLKTENKFLGAVVDDLAEGKCLGVIELSRFGNLNNYLRKPSTQPSVDYRNIDEMELQGTLPLSVLLHFCKQIAKGMEFIEQKNVIHGDLATRNVLVFENHVVKITDFGFSRKLYTRSNYTKKSKVPLPWAWMALESLCFNEYSPKTDIMCTIS